jgi:hypothetical protein
MVSGRPGKTYPADLRQRVGDAMPQDGLFRAAGAGLFDPLLAGVGPFVLARRMGQDLTHGTPTADPGS